MQTAIRSLSSLLLLFVMGCSDTTTDIIQTNDIPKATSSPKVTPQKVAPGESFAVELAVTPNTRLVTILRGDTVTKKSVRWHPIEGQKELLANTTLVNLTVLVPDDTPSGVYSVDFKLNSKVDASDEKYTNYTYFGKRDYFYFVGPNSIGTETDLPVTMIIVE